MQPLPGFRDFLPEDCASRNVIFAQMARSLSPLWIRRMGRPGSRADRALSKEKRPRDRRQLFNFTDKGEREVAMRPELTPTLARVVAAHEREFRKPLKWFSIAQCFRYEKQQRGRLREHFQLNCDIIGEASPRCRCRVDRGSGDRSAARLRFHAKRMSLLGMSDREFWTDFLRDAGRAGGRWSELLQVIDKSEREPREKTAERSSERSPHPVFEVLEERRKQREARTSSLGELGARGLGRFCQSRSLDRPRPGLLHRRCFRSSSIARENCARSPVAAATTISSQQLSDGAVSLPAVGFAMGDVVLGELIRENAGDAARMAEIVKAAKRARSLSRHREGRAPRGCVRSAAATARGGLAGRLSAHRRQRSASNFKPPKRSGRRSRCSTAMNGPR